MSSINNEDQEWLERRAREVVGWLRELRPDEIEPMLLKVLEAAHIKGQMAGG